MAATVSSQQKRSRSLIIWLLLGVLVAGIIGVDRSGILDPDEESAGTTGPVMLLPVSVEQIGAFELGDSGSVHRFERDDTGAWYYHGHADAPETPEPHDYKANPAQSELIASALGAFGRTRIQRQVGTGLEGDAFGFAKPGMIIVLYEAGQEQPLVRYVVGDLEPDELRRYLLITDQDTIVTIPNYQINNLRGMVEAVRTPRQ